MEKRQIEHRLCVILIPLLFLLAPQMIRERVFAFEWSSGNVPTQSREWKPAKFRTLLMGKSKRSDMLRLLGKPIWSGRPMGELKNDPNPEVWNDYEGGGEFPGKLSVVLKKRTGVIVSIYLYPAKLTKEDAIKHFGNEYVETRYDYDSCLGNGESAPLYESANGKLRFIEYRSFGIAIALDDDLNRVRDISYLSGPIGAVAPKCKRSRLNASGEARKL
jgi:hypothetical protein